MFEGTDSVFNNDCMEYLNFKSNFEVQSLIVIRTPAECCYKCF